MALRFPDVSKAVAPDQWHIDGMKKHGHMSPFDLLVGVALSAQPHDHCGNLAVWRGSHAPIHAAVKAAREAHEGGALPSSGPDYDSQAWWGAFRPSLRGADGGDGAVQMHLQPGDVVLAHQKLAHRISPNHSPHIRYQAYFRLSHRTHRAEAPLRSLWAHFDAVDDTELEPPRLEW